MLLTAAEVGSNIPTNALANRGVSLIYAAFPSNSNFKLKIPS